MPIGAVGFFNRFDCFGLPCRLFCLHSVHAAHPCYVRLHFLPRFCGVPCGRRGFCGLCLAAAVGRNEEQGGEKGYPVQYVAYSVSPFEGRTFPRFRADGNGRLGVFGGFRGDAVR